MADSYTTNYNFTKPEVGLSENTWGDKLNANFDAIDTALKALEPRAPTGRIVIWPTTSVPAGFLLCNGQAVSRTTYAALFAVIGTTWGSGNGSTTFNVPDLRGVFLRGLDNGKGIDTGRAIATTQQDAFESHTHNASSAEAGAHTHTVSGTAASNGAHTHSVSGTAASAGAHDHNVMQYSSNPSGSRKQAIVESTTYSTGSNADINMQTAGAHTHTVSGTAASNGAHTHTVSGTAASDGEHDHAITVEATGDSETRPVNVAINFIIKT